MDVRDDEGYTPLLMAARWMENEAAKVLLGLGAFPKAFTKEMQSALEFSSIFGNEELENVLLKAIEKDWAGWCFNDSGSEGEGEEGGEFGGEGGRLKRKIHDKAAVPIMTTVKRGMGVGRKEGKYTEYRRKLLFEGVYDDAGGGGGWEGPVTSAQGMDGELDLDGGSADDTSAAVRVDQGRSPGNGWMRGGKAAWKAHANGMEVSE